MLYWLRRLPPEVRLSQSDGSSRPRQHSAHAPASGQTTDGRAPAPLTRVKPAPRVPIFRRVSVRARPNSAGPSTGPGALIDVVRAVNSTLESARIAELIVGLASTWIPAPCWAVVSADNSGQLSVLADRASNPNMAAGIYSVAQWVMDTGEVFLSADLARDDRVPGAVPASVFALPLECRGRRVGAVVGLDGRRSSERAAVASAAPGLDAGAAGAGGGGARQRRSARTR